MRTCIALFILIPAALRAEDKLSVDDRVEILRGLSSEYATLKAYLPRSKKPPDGSLATAGRSSVLMRFKAITTSSGSPNTPTVLGSESRCYRRLPEGWLSLKHWKLSPSTSL